MKKNILIVTSEFPPQPGGIGNHAYYLGLYLSKKGYHVTVIADQRDVENEKEKVFDNQLPFSVLRISLKKPRFIMYVNRIIKTMYCFKQANYIIATGKFSLWNVSFCSLFFKRNTLAVIHGSEVNFKSSILKHAIDISLRQFENIVAVSNYTKQLVSHLKKEVIVIPNGVDLSQWQVEKLTITPFNGSPVLTTVGRVSARKGQLEVIKLLPELLKIYPNIQYHCVGIPTEANKFLKHAKMLGVDTHVTFHGVVNDKILRQILLASDVFVMLSTESITGDVEGFGIAILEANALGIPSIGSKNCGIEDAIFEGKSGFIVFKENILEFENALKCLLENPEIYKKEAKLWAKRHAWDNIVKRYIKVIEA